ncbi:hypothetical protein [Paludisphaera mucosa]|uniref:Chromosome partition protein Smc n=1 Tax=Paludisphaera mucosa TaxID=3030827 RepID=A0ABT6FL37_9BACT|nr:hypothetical protein [Paludisphaera mucosa]MDG3008267.1 hypothetical protein [Paludisphaera mucosa]
MTRTSLELRRRSTPLLILAVLAILGTASGLAHAQDAADVFDDAPADKKDAPADKKDAPAEKPAEKKDATEKKDAEKKDAPKPDAAKAMPKKDLGADPNVSDRDSIEFTQENVASQMNELEERMFRLSEALRSLEPENASRLKLALKFSREELILQQMKDARKLLKDAQLSKAETEVREMLAKLDHLRRLLLAEDLDFQMKLARLRQMRETLNRLDRIVQEERRELAWSKTAKEAKAAKDDFKKTEKDQAGNRGASDALASASSRLGNQGIALQKDLIRASAAMGEAEGQLSKEAADPAAVKQDEALKHLVKGRTDLGKAAEALLVELRTELQQRILAELNEMHEIQVSIRETTEAQAPRVAQKSRTALLLVTGLAPKEAELADRIDQLRALTEETEFGIALPTSLRVIGREMTHASELLKNGDPTEPTVVLEKRIEEDLLALAEAMRRLPASTPPKPGTPLPKDLRQREQELNRLIAELKMIRLLQSRVNDDTVKVDQGRPGEAILPPALKRDIETLESSQDEIRETLGKLAERYEGAPAEAPAPEEPAKPK